MQKNFTHNVKVYYEDTDWSGVVYHANYLKYFERARTEALHQIGTSNLKIKNKFRSHIVVKTCNFEFKKPAYLEDTLKINSYIVSFTKTSFFMSQDIIKGKDTLVHANIRLVFLNEKNKPTKIPEIIMKKLKIYTLKFST